MLGRKAWNLVYFKGRIDSYLFRAAVGVVWPWLTGQERELRFPFNFLICLNVLWLEFKNSYLPEGLRSFSFLHPRIMTC